MGGASILYDEDRAGVKISDLQNRLNTIGGGIRVEEKVDGSLGIIFFYNGKWRVSTKGSLTSEIGVIATKWINTLNCEVFDKNCTYLCEIIDISKNLVVDYKANSIILLGGYDKYGYEVSQDHLNNIVLSNNILNEDSDIISSTDISNMAEKIGEVINKKIQESNDLRKNFIFRRPIFMDTLYCNIDFISIATVTRFWRNLGEGLVVIFYYNDLTSYRVKIKTDEFIQKQRQNKNTTYKTLLKLFKKNDLKQVKEMNEEYYDDMITGWQILNQTLNNGRITHQMKY